MAGGLTVSVRQIASYAESAVAPNDLVLLQAGGMGGPYISASALSLVEGALATNGLNIGGPLSAESLTLPPGAPLAFNGAALTYQAPTGLTFSITPAGAPPSLAVTLLGLSPAGDLRLPRGTLTVARNPTGAMDVATLQWVGSNTVASFNGRRGVVTLDACDIGMALGYPTECIATLPQVDAAICSAIQDLIRTYPAVWSWNGRVGDVWLKVDDLNFVLNQPGAPPLLVPTPPAGAIDSEAVNAEWVINYITQTAGFATEAWVTAQINASRAASVLSFNGRQGTVSLTLGDIMMAGGAPLAGPSFSGVPTAPTANPGTSTAQLATTAFVMNTIVALTPGVVSFNTRSGAVTLNLADVTNAGGAPVASPNFTGTPAAPTAPQGTSTSQIATTAFVMGEIAATTAGVVSFNGRSGVVTLQLGDITAAGGAPTNNPAFTGQPAAPTAPNGTSSAQLATTAFVMNEIAAISAGVTTFNGRSGAVTLTANDVTAVGGLTNPSVALTGTPTAPTPAANDSSTNIATTAFVQAAIANIGGAYLPLVGGVSMTGLYNLSGNATANLNPVPLQQLTSTLAAYATTAAVAATYAPLASPALSGTPTVPTASAGSNTTQAASTAFVATAIRQAPFIPQNYVDNSAFTINQRSYVSGTALGGGAFGFDRWRATNVGCTLTFPTAAVGNGNAPQVVTITAGQLVQIVEAVNLLPTTYTLSWAGTAQGQIVTAAGAAISPVGPSPLTVTLTTPVPNIGLQFGGGTLSQVQLQLGSIATPWQLLPIEVELARCQRFYQIAQVAATLYAGAAGETMYASANYQVNLRAAPTYMAGGSVSGNFNWTQTAALVGFSGVTVLGGSAAAGQVIINQVVLASADL